MSSNLTLSAKILSVKWTIWRTWPGPRQNIDDSSCCRRMRIKYRERTQEIDFYDIRDLVFSSLDLALDMDLFLREFAA